MMSVKLVKSQRGTFSQHSTVFITVLRQGTETNYVGELRPILGKNEQLTVSYSVRQLEQKREKNWDCSVAFQLCVGGGMTIDLITHLPYKRLV